MKFIGEQFKILISSGAYWVSEFYKTQLSRHGYLVLVSTDPLSLPDAITAFHPQILLLSCDSHHERQIKLPFQNIRETHPRLPIILLFSSEDSIPLDVLSGVEACCHRSLGSVDALLEMITEICFPDRMIGWG